MDIKRRDSQKAAPGPESYFSGNVAVTPLHQAPEPARVVVASVSFEAGARTAWHTHPFGQTLIVTAGRGLAQRDGGKIEELNVGDVIWFAPGEKHWHGAAPSSSMTHTAIQEHENGKTADWLEKVSDAQYNDR